MLVMCISINSFAQNNQKSVDFYKVTEWIQIPGTMTCGYIVDDVNYPAQPASMSYDTDDYGVVMSFMPENYSIPGSLSKSNIVLSFDADYDNVISIESSVEQLSTIQI